MSPTEANSGDSTELDGVFESIRFVFLSLCLRGLFEARSDCETIFDTVNPVTSKVFDL
jgi:hypothetical protein